MLCDFNRQLDEALASFIFIAMIKLELSMCRLNEDQGTRLDLLSHNAERRHEDTITSICKTNDRLLTVFVLFT